MRQLGGILLALALCGLASAVAAQTPILRPERLPEPGRALASVEDSAAIRINPANLRYVPGTELRWTGVFLPDDARVSQSGHSISLSTVIPILNIPTGFRADFLQPSDELRNGNAIGVENYQWLTWALAGSVGRQASLGASVQTSLSNGAFANDLTSISLGYTHRPWNALAISVVGQHLNSPRNSNARGLSRSFEVGVGIRPLATRAVELGLEGKYLDQEDIWIPRGTLGVDLGIGRFRGDFSVSDPTNEGERAWTASAGLALYLNGMGGSAELSGGALTGSGLSGNNDTIGGFGAVASRAFREPVGVEPKRYGIRIRLESTPGVRTHVAFLRQLWSLAKEDNVDAVVFELRASPAASLGHLQELRDAVFELRRKGKRVLCHLEDGSGASLYLCAAANKVLLNPGGGIRFSGMRSRHLYFARVLKKLGIKAEFVRIGAHKSAPEQFTESGATPVSRADKIDLLQQFERGFTEGLSVGRGLSAKEVRERVADGPFLAQDAKNHGFVDELVFDDQIDEQVRKVTGRSTPLVKDRRKPTAAKTFGNHKYIAVIHVDGDISDGRNSKVPLLGMKSTGSYTIAETLKSVRENSNVRAVVIRVDSPGGSAMGSEVIWRQVKLTADAKPTVVSMGSVAASGGYYLAAPATRIFASPLTVTGSIGVFFGKADMSELLNRIGLDSEVYKTQPSADADSYFRGLSPSERKRLEDRIGEFYDLFVSRVAEGRKLSKKDVDKVAQGRVWTGEQAKAHGLVDELGGLRQAIAYARQKAGLDENTPLVILPKEPRSLLSRVLGVPGISSGDLDGATNTLTLPAAFGNGVRALVPFLLNQEGSMQARMEFDLAPLP